MNKLRLKFQTNALYDEFYSVWQSAKRRSATAREACESVTDESGVYGCKTNPDSRSAFTFHGKIYDTETGHHVPYE